MASDDDDSDTDATDPLGPARPLLLTAVRLGDRAAGAGDPDGAYALFACAARLVRKVRGLGEVADFRLDKALDDAANEDDPTAQADTLRDAFDALLGDDDEGGPDAPPDDPLGAVQAYIAMAIGIGAPAYNTGDREGCYDVYACTARMILATVDGAEPARDKLREALTAADGRDDPNDKAWVMRHAFDAVGEMGPAGEALTPREVKLFLSLAIQIGAPAFNLGDRRGCYEVYACVARLLANTSAVPDGVKESLKAALRESSTHPDVTRQAWVMRHAFDALLADAATGPDTKADDEPKPDDEPGNDPA